jgi:uncharacterized protein YbaR (Trm112 family)
MHILLTDVLACPRCGPEFGLIVLADVIEERRVRNGRLGCPNCRNSYEVADGVADLRHDSFPVLQLQLPASVEQSRPGSSRPDGSGGADPNGEARGEEAVDPADQAYRTAALLGVQGTNATILIVGGDGDTAAGVAELLPDVHVVGLTSDRRDSEPAEYWKGQAVGILSRVLSANRLPFRNGAIAAVAALGAPSIELTEELLRVLRPGGRIVVESSPPTLADTLIGGGLEVLLQQDGVTVAAGPGAR